MNKLGVLKNFKFEFLFASIFIIYTLIHIRVHGYRAFWGADDVLIEKLAKDILNGVSLSPENWKHGIGYPILIIPFIFFKHPLHVAGFFLFTFTSSTIFKNIENAIRNKKLRILIFVFVTISLVFSPDMKYWVVGASNSLSALLIILSFLWSISPIVPNFLPIILGILSGIVFSSRYIDYIFLLPLCFSAIKNYSNIYKKSFKKNLIFGFLISLIFILITLIIHKIFLGDYFLTPYSFKSSEVNRLSGDIYFDGILQQKQYFDWIIPNLYSTFIDYSSFASKLTGKGAFTAVFICPILLITPYSIVNILSFYIKKPNSEFKSKFKITTFCTFLAFVMWTIFYASTWHFTAHDLWFYCLRYFMGWFTIIVFLTLWGLTLKPQFITFFVSTILYITLIVYPYYFLKNEFKDIQIISEIQALEKDDTKSEGKLTLPIPFDNGKKSLLAETDDGIIIGVENFSTNLFLADCKNIKFDINQKGNKFKSCDFYYTGKKYEPAKGMSFINIDRIDNRFNLTYKIFEDEKPKIKDLVINDLMRKVEEKGNSSLFLEKDKRYKVIDAKNRENIIRRNNLNYLWNDQNLYYPSWPLVAAERINSKNQILTINKEAKTYCIWELNERWNFQKDRLCAQFSDDILNQNEEEFQIDINDDGYINQSIVEINKIVNINDKLVNKPSKFVYKVEPIRFKKNKLRIKFKNDLKINKDIKLDIKLINTGNIIYRNFPEKLSISCNRDKESCKAYKIGRFNNLWRIWIKAKNPINFIDINIDETKNKNPLFWEISSVSLKN
jgi:hypothetical protein